MDDRHRDVALFRYSLIEMNRLFAAWVETAYHRRAHSETAATPLERFVAGGPFVIPTPAQLYEAFLWSEHLSRTPFGRDLAPQMLHRSAGDGEAVARIDWCIGERALGVITGEVGSGKIVATRAATAALDASRHTIIYLGNPAIGARGLYAAIVSALGGVPRFHKASLIPQAADALDAEENERGKTVVVVVDEAHLLEADQLEELRLLTNADMDSHSAFACLLVGQPTLRRRIKLGTFAALDQRIALRFAMPPMAPAETSAYVAHHLGLAGRSDTLFSATPSPSSTRSHGGCRGPSTTSPSRPSSLPTPPRRPSSTSPPPEPPSPR